MSRSSSVKTPSRNCNSFAIFFNPVRKDREIKDKKFRVQFLGHWSVFKLNVVVLVQIFTFPVGLQ